MSMGSEPADMGLAFDVLTPKLLCWSQCYGQYVRHKYPSMHYPRPN